MDRIMITLPHDLLKNTDQVARRLGKNRSEFIRMALQEQLAALQKQEFETLLAEGYQEMADQSQTLANEAMAIQAASLEGVWVWDE